MMTTTTALILLGTIAVLVAAIGYFAVMLQGRMRANERRGQDEFAAVREELQELRTQLMELRTELMEMAAQPPPEPPMPPPAPAPGHSLNLTKRSQVLRMCQRGSQPDQIASVLGLHVNEVELILKLHKLLNLPSRAADERATFTEL